MIPKRLPMFIANGCSCFRGFNFKVFADGTGGDVAGQINSADAAKGQLNKSDCLKAGLGSTELTLPLRV